LPPVKLEWSPFAAPPSPAGLAATVDSAAGVARLSWKPVSLSNFHHYEVTRSGGRDTVFTVTDTLLVDSLRGVPPGARLEYRVKAVNALGNKSPDPPAPAVATAPDSSATGASGTVKGGVSTAQGLPAAGALVILYAAPAKPGPPDSLPIPVKPVDTLRAGSGGLFSFPDVPPGTYGLEARDTATGARAMITGLALQAGGSASANPVLGVTGRLQGTATRQRLWCSSQNKGNEGILVSLAGTPYATITRSIDGIFALDSVPPGHYRLVVMAPPRGCFLPDTLGVDIVPGAVTQAGVIGARYNADLVPMATGLRIESSGGGKVGLAWYPVSSEFQNLQGYQVFRRDDSLRVTATSPVGAAVSWSDDVSALPKGTRISYVVQTVGKDGKRSRFAGNDNGGPVTYVVP
jgi:hypothetical protein